MMRDMGWKGVSLYTLRHTYATTQLRKGVDSRTVQQHMGHASLRTTEGCLTPVAAEQHVTDVLSFEKQASRPSGASPTTSSSGFEEISAFNPSLRIV